MWRHLLAATLHIFYKPEKQLFLKKLILRIGRLQDKLVTKDVVDI